MTELFESAISKAQQPKPEDFSFDLDACLSSIVCVRAQVPDDAYTARRMGTERAGHGITIGPDGLVVTIGYLITEAEEIWIIDDSGKACPGHVIGQDPDTGFGLVQALQPISAPVMEMGSTALLNEGDPVIVAGYGGRRHALGARVMSKREFTGYWEYLLEEGIFTAPPHPNWGGAGLISTDGKLLGVGSLFIQQILLSEQPVDGNMFVPIDLLKEILDDLKTYGTTRKPPRPWIGITTAEAENRLVVARVTRRGPARKAGILVGDFIVAINGKAVSDLADMYRKIWALGEAGVDVPMTIIREGDALEIRVHSTNRTERHRKPNLN